MERDYILQQQTNCYNIISKGNYYLRDYEIHQLLAKTSKDDQCLLIDAIATKMHVQHNNKKFSIRGDSWLSTYEEN